MKDAVVLFPGIMVERVKELPGQVDVLISRIDDPAIDPAVRCALVSALAYVSQARDLVPDDAPGGYGFVDDCAMLTAAHLHMLEPTAANAARIEALQQTLDGLQSVLPVQVNDDMQQTIEGLVLLVQSIRALPAEVAEGLVQQALDDPEGVVPPQAAPGSRNAGADADAERSLERRRLFRRRQRHHSGQPLVDRRPALYSRLVRGNPPITARTRGIARDRTESARHAGLTKSVHPA